MMETASSSQVTILSQERNLASKCLLVMCGLPGAGKTTLVDRLQQVMSLQSVLPYAVQWQSQTSSEFQPDAWKKARATALAMVEEYLSFPTAGDEAPRQHLIVVDDNMYYRSMRYTCFQLARRHQAAFVQLFISCPLALAQHRNATRPGHESVPDHVLMRMHSLLQAPEPDRFPWEANTVVLAADSAADSLSNQVMDSLQDKILEKWKEPVAPRPSQQAEEEARQASRAVNHASLLHQLDLLCRGHLSEAMHQLTSSKNVGKHLKVSVARKLNTARQATLAALREADESQAEAVFRILLAGFAHTCNSTVASPA